MSDTNWSRSGDGNLFLEADPAQPTSHRPASVRHPRHASRGRGLVVPLEASLPNVTVFSQRADAASFTRPTTRLGRLQTRTREQARRADENARRLMAAVTARRYTPLLALALVGALLLAVSWIGLALRDASVARHSANRRAAAAVATAARDQARISALYALLVQTRATQPVQTRVRVLPAPRSHR